MVGGAVARVSFVPVTAQASVLQFEIVIAFAVALTVTVAGPPSKTNSHFAPGASGFIGTQTFSQRISNFPPPSGVNFSTTVPWGSVQTLLIVQVAAAVTVKPPSRLPASWNACPLASRQLPSTGVARPVAPTGPASPVQSPTASPMVSAAAATARLRRRTEHSSRLSRSYLS